MLERWRRRQQNREIVDRLYEQLVARARRPGLYLEGGLPDTVMGRFEALGIEVFVFMTRCKEEAPLRALSQDLVDRFMLDLDHSIRELGVGYLAVPKRMRKLAAQFYSRISLFEAPLREGDEAALSDRLQTTALEDAGDKRADAAGHLAHYMISEHRRYEGFGSDRILAGDLPAPG